MEDPKIILFENIQNTLLEIQTKIDFLNRLQPITFSGLIALDLIGYMPLYGLEYVFGGVILGYLAMESMVGIPKQITFLEEEYQFLNELKDTIDSRDFEELNDEYNHSIVYLETLNYK